VSVRDPGEIERASQFSRAPAMAVRSRLGAGWRRFIAMSWSAWPPGTSCPRSMGSTRAVLGYLWDFGGKNILGSPQCIKKAPGRSIVRVASHPGGAPLRAPEKDEAPPQCGNAERNERIASLHCKDSAHLHRCPTRGRMQARYCERTRHEQHHAGCDVARLKPGRLLAAGAAKVYPEKVSGSAKAHRAELMKVVNKLEPGDVLMVTRLDRLARSTRDLLNLLDTITLRDTWADTTNAHGRLIITVLAGLAEFERELIRSRCGEDIARAKERGVRFGRPPELTPHQRREAGSRPARPRRTLPAATTPTPRPSDRWRAKP
jgi:Resolvase, N terminal domain